jgi:hypothetical protein
VFARQTTVANTPGQATIYGMLWGGNQARTVYYSSSMQNIMHDLGYLYIWWPRMRRPR